MGVEGNFSSLHSFLLYQHVQQEIQIAFDLRAAVVFGGIHLNTFSFPSGSTSSNLQFIPSWQLTIANLLLSVNMKKMCS